MRGYLAVGVVLSGIIGLNSASAETTIGRWCDKMVPNMPQYNGVISIILTDGGKVVARSKFNDGSSMENELLEISGNVFKMVVSPHGDKYRIVPNNGELQLLDNDGLIRVAERLENTPQPRECR